MEASSGTAPSVETSGGGREAGSASDEGQEREVKAYFNGAIGQGANADGSPAMHHHNSTQTSGAVLHLHFCQMWIVAHRCGLACVQVGADKQKTMKPYSTFNVACWSTPSLRILVLPDALVNVLCVLAIYPKM